jgi:hypothetical protein
VPNSDFEVFEYFSSSNDTTRERDFLAFGSYSFDKFAWMKHFEDISGRPPTDAEVTVWIQQLPPSRLDEIRVWAEQFFDTAARAYMRDEIDQLLLDSEKAATVAAVKSSNEAVEARVTDAAEALRTAFSATSKELKESVSFKNTWLPNVFIGLISSFLFALLIIGASLIFARDPSPIALAKKVHSDITNTTGH